jgi:glycosyltransferase involved in cell wall biosynthesis
MIVGVVIARNEEHQLAHCLDSLGWTDANLVVLDNRTTDRSAIVAREHGADVVERRFVTFPCQRNAALEAVATAYPDSWVFFVDHDERATPALAAEIKQVVARGGPGSPVGYWVPRRNMIWGGWIRYGGWSPDYQLRLLKTGKVYFDENRDVHELAVLNGTAGHLCERLVHFNYDRLAQFLAKQELYSTLEAQRLRREGWTARPQNFVLQPWREFHRRYVELKGYKDGWRGLILSVLLAWYAAVTYAKLAFGR